MKYSDRKLKIDSNSFPFKEAKSLIGHCFSDRFMRFILLMKNSEFLYMIVELTDNYTEKTRSQNAKVIFVPKSRKIKHKVIIEKIHPYF